MISQRSIRKKLGELLIERGLLTQEQLNKGLDDQKRKGGYLSQHLIALGYVTDVDIAICLSNQYNFAYLPLKNYSIPPDVRSAIPLKCIKIYTLMPVDKVRNLLSVAMADPLNEGVIEMLHQMTNCEIQVFISTYSEINDTIERYFKEQLLELKLTYLDAGDIGKAKTANEFIQTKSYFGKERREYVRIEKGLDISFYFHGTTFQKKTKDICYGGVAFYTDTFLPIDTNITCKISLYPDKPPIDVVVNILRTQLINSQPGSENYEIAGMFAFFTNEDRETLVNFLKQNIP